MLMATGVGIEKARCKNIATRIKPRLKNAMRLVHLAEDGGRSVAASLMIGGTFPDPDGSDPQAED